jgi:hypothetical protein
MLAAVFIFFEILQEEEEEEVKEKEKESVLSLPNLTVNTTLWW